MSASTPHLPHPIPIYFTNNVHYVFNPQHLSHLRAAHRIPGLLTGTLPQSPQQNLFLGLPARLLPEEARLLVELGVGVVVDDPAAHADAIRWLDSPNGLKAKRQWLEELADIGRDMTRGMESAAKMRQENALGKLDEGLRERVLRGDSGQASSTRGDSPVPQTVSGGDADEAGHALFSSGDHAPGPVLPASTAPADSSAPKPAAEEYCIITPTTSHPPLRLLSPSAPSAAVMPRKTPAYPLYRHIHQLPRHSYFLSPGLRFGCQFMVYPGDPLRFHSHFLAVAKAWDEEFDLMTLIGGGRLGTGVKKGYLIGGARGVVDAADEEARDGGEEVKPPADDVRCFCIEWAGM